MACIQREVTVEIDPMRAWATLRRVHAAAELFAPVLTDSSVEGDIRTVTFANGMVARERIVDVDDDRRRVVYSALDVPGISYHHASMQILDAGKGRSRFVWTTDVLPAGAVAAVEPLVEQGTQALKANLERTVAPARRAAP
jgi:hypothetical protein